MGKDLKTLAEQYFLGVYGGNPAVVDDLGEEDILCSYPIFEQLFKTPTLHGREAVKAFSTGFGKRWTEAQITIHETIAEGSSVVFVWSFQARSSESKQEQSWGGFTLIRFSQAGK